MSSSPAASPTPSNLRGRAPRRLHPGSARIRVDDRAAAARRRARHRARAAPLQLPRHDAAALRPGRRRAVRRRRRAWCCGSTSSRRRSRPSTAARRSSASIALTPQGRPLTQAVVEELASEPALTLLSSRFEGFDERIVTHLCSDAISIGPYVLSGGELPAMVLLDAIARRLPGALAEGSGEHESFSVELEGGLEYPHYTRPAEFRGWQVPDVLLSGDHGRVDEWRRAQSRERSDVVSDREDEGGRDREGWDSQPGRVVPAADRLAAAAGAAARARAEGGSCAARGHRRRRARRDRLGAGRQVDGLRSRHPRARDRPPDRLRRLSLRRAAAAAPSSRSSRSGRRCSGS